MTDDTDTIRVPDYRKRPPAKPADDAPKRPDNTLLIVATALLTAVAATMFMWTTDEQITHAQVSLIASVVLIVGATAALSCHLMRVWIRAVEARIAAAVATAVLATTESEDQTATLIDGIARRSRSQFYDLSSDVAAVDGQISALKALMRDFIKRYPPQQQDLGAVDRDEVWLSDVAKAVDLGKQLGRQGEDG